MQAIRWMTVLVLGLFATLALAGPPRQIAYQGILELDGQAVTGNVSLEFFLLNDPADDLAAPLWTETQTPVAVSKGRFAVNLGSVTPIPATVLTRDSVYLAIKVDGNEMSGRKVLVPVPYAAESLSTPPGTIVAFAGSVAPDGWLLCDEKLHDVAVYPQLAAVLADTYGGDGLTTFGVPDLRGRMPLGMDNMGGNPANNVESGAADMLNGSGGEDVNTTVPQHRHGISDSGNHQHNLKTTCNGGGCNDGNDSIPRSALGSIDTATFKTLTGGNHNHGGNTHNAGAAGGVTNMPPFLTLNYIIKH